MTATTTSSPRIALHDYRAGAVENRGSVANIAIHRIIAENGLTCVPVAEGTADVVFAHVDDLECGIGNSDVAKSDGLFPAYRNQIFVLMSTIQSSLASKMSAQKIHVGGVQRYIIIPRSARDLMNKAILDGICRLSIEEAEAIVQRASDNVPDDLLSTFGLVRVSGWIVAMHVLCSAYLARHGPDRKNRRDDLNLSRSEWWRKCLEPADREECTEERWTDLKRYCDNRPDLSLVAPALEELVKEVFDQSFVSASVVEDARRAIQQLMTSLTAPRVAIVGVGSES